MDKTHWFPVWTGTKAAPIKVVCNCDGWDILGKSGFIKDPSELPESVNLLSVSEMTSKNDIEEYVKKKTGIDLDKRGSLETVREKAKAALNESGRAD